MKRTNSHDAFYWHKLLYTITGIWPYRSPSLIYRMRHWTSWILAFGLAGVMYTEAIVEGGDFIKLSKILFIQIQATTYIVKMANFVYHHHEFLELIDYLDSPIFYCYPKQFDEHIKGAINFNNLLTISFLGNTAFVVVMIGVTPFVTHQTFAVPFPYDLGKYNFLMYLFQMLGIVAAGWNHNVLDVLTTAMMSIAIGHLEILGKMLGNLEERERHLVGEEVVCVRYHQAIIKYVESLQSIFTFGFLVQFMGSIVVVCNTLFDIVLVGELSVGLLMFGSYLSVMLSQLYLYCYFGNEIMVKSLDIGRACYMTSWFTYDPEVKKNLLQMMQRSQTPLTLTAFKLSTLSHAAFTSVLQWAYSYFTVLMKMYTKKTIVSEKNVEY